MPTILRNDALNEVCDKSYDNIIIHSCDIIIVVDGWLFLEIVCSSTLVLLLETLGHLIVKSFSRNVYIQ